MKGRNTLAKHIMRDGLLDWTRGDPCDINNVDLRWLDFSSAFNADNETGLVDIDTREFLLFQDQQDEVQKGLVVFVNNAEDVFGPRSNQGSDVTSLDCHLAELFANLQVCISAKAASKHHRLLKSKSNTCLGGRANCDADRCISVPRTETRGWQMVYKACLRIWPFGRFVGKPK